MWVFSEPKWKEPLGLVYDVPEAEWDAFVSHYAGMCEEDRRLDLMIKRDAINDLLEMM